MFLDRWINNGVQCTNRFYEIMDSSIKNKNRLIFWRIAIHMQFIWCMNSVIVESEKNCKLHPYLTNCWCWIQMNHFHFAFISNFFFYFSFIILNVFVIFPFSLVNDLRRILKTNIRCSYVLCSIFCICIVQLAMGKSNGIIKNQIKYM